MRMSPRGSFSIIGDQAEPVAVWLSFAKTALADRRPPLRCAMVAWRSWRSISSENAGCSGRPNMIAHGAAKTVVG